MSFLNLFIIISDEIFQLSMSSLLFSSFQGNTKCESSFFADTCTRCVPIFSVAVVIANYKNFAVNPPLHLKLIPILFKTSTVSMSVILYET
jgi:hypothetical protein